MPGGCSERGRPPHVAQLGAEDEAEVEEAVGAVRVHEVRDAERREQDELQRRRALQQPQPRRPAALRRVLQLRQPATFTSQVNNSDHLLALLQPWPEAFQTTAASTVALFETFQISLTLGLSPPLSDR